MLKIFNIWENIFRFIWWLSETSGISLNKYGPFVFEQKIGAKRKLVETKDKEGVE